MRVGEPGMHVQYEENVPTRPSPPGFAPIHQVYDQVVLEEILFAGQQRSHTAIVPRLSPAEAPTRFGEGTSRIVEHCHEPKIHVQLLVTMEQRGSGIVGNKVELYLLEPA